MAVQLYLRDAATTVTGTLPGATSAYNTDTGSTVSATATGASTNRSMTITPGSAQVAATLSTLASTGSQTNWFRRFISPPLAAQSLNSITITIALAGLTSNSNSPFVFLPWLDLWRPSTGKVSNAVFVTSTITASSVETGAQIATISPYSAAVLDGDVFVLEVLGKVSQAMATSYTWTLDYEGTTDPASNIAIGSAASLISFSVDIPLYMPSIIVPQAANNSSGASPLVSAKPPKGELFLPENMMDLGSRSRLPNQNWSTGVFVPPSDTTPPTVDFTIVGR